MGDHHAAFWEPVTDKSAYRSFADPKPSEKPVNSKRLMALFDSLEETKASISAALAKHGELEKELIGRTSRADLMDSSLENYAETILEHLFDNAVAQFSLPGIPLAIDSTYELTEMGLRNWKSDFCRKKWQCRNELETNSKISKYPLDIDFVWTRLQTTLENGGGERRCYQQQAKSLVDAFGLTRSEPRTNAYGVILEASFSGRKNTYGGQNHGKYEFDHDYRKTWKKNIVAFQSLAKFSGNEKFSENLNSLDMSMEESFHFKAPFLLEYETFKFKISSAKVEIIISKKIAEQLQCYLGEFLA